MRSLFHRLEAFPERLKLYVSILAVFYCFAWAFVSLKGDLNLVVSDGRYYYAYLPSWFIDGDLNFENQIRENWGVDFNERLLADRTPTGRVRNKYPIGIAVTLTPAFLVVHGVISWLAPPQANGYGVAYQAATLLLILGLGLGGLVLCDRLLTSTLGFRGEAVAVAVSLYWVATPFAFYYFREPFMPHMVSFFWVTASFYCFEVLRARPSMAAAFWFFPALAMAVICRPTNALLGILPLSLLGLWPAVFFRSSRVRLVALGLGVLVGTVLLGTQALVWKLSSGHWLYYSYQDEGFHWLAPRLFSTLFSSQHGLFFWAPLLLLAVYGWVRRPDLLRQPICRALLIGWVVLWYVNSSWHCWFFGDAFGARAFLEFTLVYLIGLTAVFSRWLERRYYARIVAVASASLFFNWGLMFLYLTHRISRNGPLF